MKAGYRITLSLLAATGIVLAQDAGTSTGPSSGWKPVGGSGQAPALQQNAPLPVDPPQAAPAAPAQLDLKAGTYITVRVNQSLSSDKNQTGDTFTATLLRPLIVDGFVVAQPNQTLGGRVAEAIRAGKAQGVSHLGLQLTDLMFVDGQHAPIQSELVSLSGPGTIGHAPTTVNTGAAGNTPGVLLTHGKATVIGPESVLTFKIDSDISIATAQAPQAFRPVGPGDYSQPQARPGYAPGSYYAGAYPYGAYAYPYGYPYSSGYPYYGYPYYPYYWGPGVGLYFGGGWGWGGGFRGRWR